jgi:Asp-tRNA(Asn)/Glu-tRNA(Gln) amidotransferase A subunit family amidase
MPADGTGRVEEALERIARLDPQLCAFIEVWPERALAAARSVDPGLPLAGLPFAVKGPSGIRSYAAGRLMAAGAVPVGATAVPDPGTYWQTWGRGRYGRTLNPYRADRTPGGSSAGSAVAVAAGMVPLATGSDGAGSVRIPAAWCGVFGLKTTNGLVPSPDRTGLASAGVLTARAADARAYLRSVCGAPAAPPPLPVPAEFSPDLGLAEVDPAVAEAVRAGVASLEAAGVVRTVTAGTGRRRPFALQDPREAWTAVRAGRADEAAAVRLRAANDRTLAEFFESVPLLIAPVTPNRPHGHEGPGRSVYSTALTWAFNLSGHPAASICAGWTPDGCPVGLQLVAGRGAEELLVTVAQAAEERGVTARP